MNNFKNYFELHLFELRYSLFYLFFTFFYLFFVTYYFSNEVIYLLINILMEKNFYKYFIFSTITELYYTNIFISIVISFLITCKCFLFECWFFLMGGLYKYENLIILKLYIYFFISNIVFFFIILFKIIPKIGFFFLNINKYFSMIYLFNIYFEPNFYNYFLFIYKSSLYIYLTFIYFFFLFYLILIDILKIKTLIFLRKFFYLKFIIISSIISPPDLISQCIPIFFFFLIFEFSIFLNIFLERYFR